MDRTRGCDAYRSRAGLGGARTADGAGVSALIASVREAGSEPSGMLRVLLPIGLPPHLRTPMLGFVHHKYPRLSFHLQFSDDPTGGLIEDVDLAFHFGDASPSRAWVSKEIVRSRVWAVASRDYLQQRGTPRTLDDLKKHELMTWVTGTIRRWPLCGGSYPVSAMTVTRHIHLIRQFAIAEWALRWFRTRCFSIPGAGWNVGSGAARFIGKDVGMRVMIPAVLWEIPHSCSD